MKTNEHKGTPFILYLLVTLSPLGIDLHLPALVDIKNHFKITENLAQLSVLSFVFSMGIGQLLFGFWSQKQGKKKIGYVGAIAFIAGSVGVLFSIGYHLLLLFRILQGLGASALSVIAYATVNENYNEKEASIIFSIQNGFLNIIPATAPVLGAFLLSLWNWKLIFIFFIFYGISTLFIFTKKYHYIDAVSDIIYSQSIMRICTDKKFFFYAGICVLCLGYIMTYLSLAPILMIEVFKTSPLVFSIYFSINAVIISMVSFSLKKIIVRYDTKSCVIFGLILLVISSLGLLGFSNHMNINLFWLLIAIGSTGFSFTFGPSMSFALSNHQEHSGIAAGFLGFIYLTFSPLVAFLILRNSNNSILLYGLCFSVLSSLFLGLLIFSSYGKIKTN